MAFQVLLGVLLFTLIGVLLGIITGLTPGIHVNTVALLIMAFSPVFFGISGSISAFLGAPEGTLIFISAIIIGNLITHTFLDFIPSALFGAPDEDMALSVLPAHRLVLRGEGRKAIRISATGSLHAVLIALLLLIPAYIFFGVLNGYERLEPYIPYILMLIVAVLIAEEAEKGRIYSLYAISIFLLSGIFGWIVLNGNTFSDAPMLMDGMRGSAPIFSGLLGLFGLPALIQSAGVIKPVMKEKDEKSEGAGIKHSFLGTISGAFVGWFPGVTSASATVLASNLSGDRNEESFIGMMSAVNTSNAVFVILALFVIGKARNGTLKVVQSMLSPEIWKNPVSPPSMLFILLFSVTIAAALSYPLTIFFGDVFLKRVEKVDYRSISSYIMVFLLILCLIMAGPVGLYVSAVATMIGLIPPLIGINRVHLMGFLIMPTILYFMGVA